MFTPPNLSPLSKSASKASEAERAAMMGDATKSPGVKNMMVAGVPAKAPPKMAKGGLLGLMEEVPPGALPNEVADDQDVKLSEGEVVIPADVVRWVGLEKLEQMRAKAKSGLMAMAQDGRITNGEDEEDEDEGEDPEDTPRYFPDSAVETPKMAQGGLVGDAYTQAYNAKNPNTPVSATVDASGRKGYQFGSQPAPTVTASKYTPSSATTGTLKPGTGGVVVPEQPKGPSTMDQIKNVAGGAAGIIGTTVAGNVVKDVVGGQTLGQSLNSNIVQPVSSLFGAGGMNGGSAAAAAGAPGQLTAPGALSPASVTTSELGSGAASQAGAQTGGQTAGQTTGGFSQGLGGAALGAGLGWATGKLTGGNTTASTIAGGVSGLVTSGALGFGSTAGLTGSMWGTGAIGGPAGVGIAIAASLIAGQLFKKKPSNKAAEAQVTFDSTGPATVIGDPQKASKRDPENMSIRDGYVHIASEFGKMLQQAGATAVPNVQLNIGSRDGWQFSVGYNPGHSSNYEFKMKNNSSDLAAVMVMDMVKDSRGIPEALKSRFTDMDLVKYAMSKDNFSPLFDQKTDLRTIYDSEDFKSFASKNSTVGYSAQGGSDVS